MKSARAIRNCFMLCVEKFLKDKNNLNHSYEKKPKAIKPSLKNHFAKIPFLRITGKSEKLASSKVFASSTKVLSNIVLPMK